MNKSGAPARPPRATRTQQVNFFCRVYNLNSQREVGVLMEHTATITCSDFWGKANAITGDATGTLCIWRCADWLNLHSCEAHRYAHAHCCSHAPHVTSSFAVAR